MRVTMARWLVVDAGSAAWACAGPERGSQAEAKERECGMDDTRYLRVQRLYRRSERGAFRVWSC